MLFCGLFCLYKKYPEITNIKVAVANESLLQPLLFSSLVLDRFAIQFLLSSFLRTSKGLKANTVFS